MPMEEETCQQVNIVLALVVMCIAVVALAAVQSRQKAKVEPKESMPIDQRIRHRHLLMLQG